MAEGTMKAFRDSSLDIDLKCDFPARESFRDSLLTHLLAKNEQAEQKAASVVGAEHPDYDPEARELTDDELELLAAAQGQLIIPDNWMRT